MLAVTVPGDPGGTLIFTRMLSQGNSCEFGHYDYAHSFVRSLRIYSRAVHADGNYMQDHAGEIAKTIKKMLIASMKVEVGANPIRLYPPVTYDSLIHETTHLPSADLTQRLTMLNNSGEFANN